MEEVDANDNGIATHDGKARYAVTTTLASRVANLRPHWNDPEQDFDKGNLFRNIDKKNQDGEFQFSNFSCRFLNPNNFFQFEL